MTETIMTCERVDASLSAYLDGDLPPAERRAVDAHLGTCLRCASLVRDIDAIRRDAANLPELAPSRDLWNGIAARIEAPVVPLNPQADRSSARRGWRLGLAAAGLVAVTAGVTYTITVRQGGLAREGPPAVATSDTAMPADGTTKAANVASLPVEVTYAREIAELRDVLERRRGSLDSTTVAVVELSIATIDRAIAEARAALELDPASAFLNDQLNRALAKKLGLLRTVALLPSRS